MAGARPIYASRLSDDQAAWDRAQAAQSLCKLAGQAATLSHNSKQARTQVVAPADRRVAEARAS